jgi:hypothetical protein
MTDEQDARIRRVARQEAKFASMVDEVAIAAPKQAAGEACAQQELAIVPLPNASQVEQKPVTHARDRERERDQWGALLRVGKSAS